MERARRIAYRLGDAVLVEPSLHRVVVGGETRRVTPKAIQVLELLLERPGELVRREELLDGVWPETAIGEDVLTRAIADLRKALDDRPGDPWAIETVPKAGYRLIASVRPGWPPPENEPTPAATPARRSGWPRLARAAAMLAALVVAATAVAAVVATVRAVRSHPPAAPPRVVPITSLPGLETGPALSPDGSRVAFASLPADAARSPMDADWNLFVGVVGQESRLQLTFDPAPEVSPAWSPAGDVIAFLRREAGGCAVVAVPALGGAERRIGSCGKNVAADLDWSPDGRWLAFSDRDADDQPFRIVLLAADGSERRALPPPAAQHWGDRDPVFTPDSRAVVFLRSVSMATQDLYRAAIDPPAAGKPERGEPGRGEPERVTHDGRFLGGHAFADDGSLIFVSARSGSTDLWRLPAGGGPPAWLGASVVRPRSPTVRGDRLVVESWTFDADLFRLDLTTEAATPAVLARSTREEILPALSPGTASAEPSRVAFVSTRSGSFEIWVADGAGARALTAFGGPYVGSPSWSPDGRRIAFDARPEGHADVWVVDLDGGAPRRLTDDPANDLAPSWSPDGRAILFGSDRGGRWQAWRVAAEAGDEAGEPAPEPVRLTDDGAYAPRLSPDGAWLWTSRFDSTSLFRRPLAGGAAVEVPATASCYGWARCALTAGGLLAVRQVDGASRLAVLDPETGQPIVDRAFPGSVDVGLAVAADGSSLVFSQAVEQTSDLVGVELPPARR